uniref:Uncharacterized protein n=1 Tax=Trypanosoma congolense (strain IL3000) TaxID=1068625 RepID=F9W508_TRYCI|nr:hypothetical protein, unlikely [Trypanosoma congolense IL3000]
MGNVSAWVGCLCEGAAEPPAEPVCMAFNLAYEPEDSRKRSLNPLKKGLYTTLSAGKRIGASSTGCGKWIVQANGISNASHILRSATEGSITMGEEIFDGASSPTPRKSPPVVMLWDSTA